MALVTMKKLLQQAKNEGRGVGAFSVGNMEMVKGAIQAAEELETPEKHNYFSLNEAMVQGTYENVLHHIKVFNGAQPV